MKAAGLGAAAAREPTSRLRQALLFAAVVAGSFAIYMSNPQTLASYDSAPNSLLAFNLLQNHRLDFDSFRASYFTALGGGYAFVEAPNGHLTSVFPIGAALVTLPLYVVFSLTSLGGAHAGAIESPAFEPLRVRDEKLAAAAVAALSVGLFLLCAREIGNAVPAGIATAVYAFGTSIWSIGAQALWQHGPVNLFVLAFIYALFRAGRARDSDPRAAGRAREGADCWAWLALAGACAGLLPIIRPTAILFSIAGLIFVGFTFRRKAWFFVATLIIGALPGVAWNAYFFHSLLGGYAGGASSYAPSGALAGWAGLLVSPSRGLFIFSPVLAFSFLGAVRVAQTRERNARLLLLLTAAGVVLVLQYGFYRYWWAGYSYGPRFLTDLAGLASLLLVYVIPPDPLSFARRSAARGLAATAFVLLFVFSVAVQFAGTNSGAAGSEWNAVPISVDRRPERVWEIADNQIERNMRAAVVRFFAWNLASSTTYTQGVGAGVAAITPALTNVAKGATLDTTAVVSNIGQSRLYGYNTGVYVGQIRVRARILDAAKHVVSEQLLYVRGAPAAGERAPAIGIITLPPQAGTYLIECDPILAGSGTILPAAHATVLRALIHAN